MLETIWKYIKEYCFYFLLFALLIPLFQINIIHSHDWGGDFAQYIQQAILIAKGQAQADTHYIFNEDYSFLGPPSYNVGFPLILSPVCALFGNDIFAFLLLNTSLLVLALLLVFHFLKSYFSPLIALSATLIFAYNPWLLSFKGEVQSDISFMLFFMASIAVYNQIKDRLNWKNALLLSALIAYTMLIKNIGLVLLLSIGSDYIWRKFFLPFLKEKKVSIAYGSYIWIVFVFIASFAFYFLIAEVVFSSKMESFSFFSTLFSVDILYDTILKNLDYYIQVFQNFFQSDFGQWSFFPLITKSFALVFLILGVIRSCIPKMNFNSWVYVLYVLVILTYPNSTQGFRFLLPLFPLSLLYIIEGVKGFNFGFKIKGKYLALIVTALLLLQYRLDIVKVNNRGEIVQGPQSESAAQVFAYLRENTDPKARIVFNKPRVLGLYAQRDSYAVWGEPLQVESQLERLGFDYLMHCNELYDVSMEKFLEKSGDDFHIVYSNEVFTLFQKRQ